MMKHLLIAVAIGLVTGAVFRLVVVPSGVSDQPSSFQALIQTTLIKPRISLPASLYLPSLGIRAPVEAVGLDEAGRMAVPSSADQVGWYRYGPRPGEVGQAVIDGHLDTSAAPAVFANLHRLQVNDTVIVTDTIGQSYTFIVVKTAVYKDNRFPVEAVFGPVSTSKLNLITCDGAFNQNEQNYSDRLVVFTEMKEIF